MGQSRRGDYVNNYRKASATMTNEGRPMSKNIPLPEDTTQSTETALDKTKPQSLPHEAEQERPAQVDHQPPASEEHPISVGKP